MSRRCRSPLFPGLEGADVVGHALASALLASLVAEWLVAGRGRRQRSGMWGGLAAAFGAMAGETAHHLAARWITPRPRLTRILNLAAPAAVVAALVVGS